MTFGILGFKITACSIKLKKFQTSLTVLFIALFVLAGLVMAAPSEPPKRAAIVLNSGEASVSLIDMDKRSVYKTFPISKEPHYLMITPDQKPALVANAVSDDVAFLDPKAANLQGRTPNIIDRYHIGYSPDKNGLLLQVIAWVMWIFMQRKSTS